MAGEDDRNASRTGVDAASESTRSDARDLRDTSRESRLPLERVLPELLKRGLLAGRDVSESIFPRELASTIISQLGDARQSLVTAVATEVGRFLRQADVASELRKVLAGLHIEAKVQLRFSEDETGKLKPRIDLEQASASSSRRTKSTPPEGG